MSSVSFSHEVFMMFLVCHNFI